MMFMFFVSLLIFNGKGVNELQLCEVVNLLCDEGIDIYVCVIWEKGDVVWFIDEVLQLNVEMVIVGGGDGIINEVVIVLVECGGKMVLGILLLGMVNDFVISVGILQDLVSVFKLVIVGCDVLIDIVRVNDKIGFINMVIGGFGIWIIIEMLEKFKVVFGGVFYLIYGLMCMDILKLDCCEICGENFYWQGDVLVIGIGNGCQVGGGQQLCLEVLINDGLLYLCIFIGEELIFVLFSILVNLENLLNIVDGVFLWFEIIVFYEMIFNFDGELFSGKIFCMELLLVVLCCWLLFDCLLLC